MIIQIKNFRISEFFCPCCKKGFVAEPLVFWLEILRRAFGNPIQVNSGFRCPLRNKQVGGVPDSRHLVGCAADIAPIDFLLWDKFLDLSQKLFSFDGFEFKIYARHVHVAVTRSEARRPWPGGQIQI